MKHHASLYSALSLATFIACSSATKPPPSAPTAPEDGETADSGYAAPRLEPDVAVKASFETSTAAVSPGSSFLVAAHFRIEDGYRLSWLNPGDIGKEMAIEFTAPEGFEVSAPMFPGPKKYDLPDGYVSYGYDGETAVFAEVRVPANVVPDEVYRFELSAKWLACKGSCLKEGVEAYFELVGSSVAANQGFDGALPRFLESVPQPLSHLDGAALEWRDSGTLAIRASGVTWKEFYPSTIEHPALSQMSVDSEASELVLHFEHAAPVNAVQGVLLAEIGGQQRYVAINETRPSEEEEETPTLAE